MMKSVKSSEMVVTWLFVAVLVGQFAPTAVASESESKNDKSVTTNEEGNPPDVPSGAGQAKDNVPLINKTAKASCNNTGTATTNCTALAASPSNFVNKLLQNKGMLKRTFYVLVGVMAIVIVYFVVRAVRTRRRKSRIKRYGVISKQGDNLEMTPLDQDDDDEDMTVFDLSGQPK